MFAAAFSPDGRNKSPPPATTSAFWSGSRTKSTRWTSSSSWPTRRWRRKRAVRSKDIRRRFARSAFSADGEYLLSGGDDNTVRIWDTVTGKLASRAPRPQPAGVRRAVFSPDGRQVLSAGQEGQIKLWNILDYKRGSRTAGPRARRARRCHPVGRVLADGTQIVTGSRDHTARVFDAQTGKSLHVFKEGHEFLASRAIYFADGRWLLTAGGDNSVRIWDAETGAQLSSIEGTGRNAAVAVSRDGKWILSGKSVARSARQSAGGLDKESPTEGIDPSLARMALWEVVDEGRSVRRHELADRRFGTGHRTTITTLAISPDRRWFFSGDDSGVGKLWDATTGAEAPHDQGTLKRHYRLLLPAARKPLAHRQPRRHRGPMGRGHRTGIAALLDQCEFRKPRRVRCAGDRAGAFRPTVGSCSRCRTMSPARLTSA